MSAPPQYPWRKHAAQRCRERFGIKYTRKVRREMVRRVPLGEVLSETAGRQVVRISYQLQEIRVVYDKNLDDIITILPE